MKTCFFIAPIGESGSEIRGRSDRILKYVVAPAVAQCGYTALRADQISEPGLITTRVIQHVIDDPLVIADLTGPNPNVFYELAIRHAVRKPLVQIIKQGEQLPFDVAGMRTVELDHTDLESAEEAKAEIVRQIEALERNPQGVNTPISVAIDIQNLRKSDNPEKRTLSDLLSSVFELKAGVGSLHKSIDALGSTHEEWGEYLQRLHWEMVSVTRRLEASSNDLLMDAQIRLAAMLEEFRVSFRESNARQKAGD